MFSALQLYLAFKQSTLQQATPIRNIIFDFGGVIIDLDMQRTEDAFIKLGVQNFNDHFNQLKQSALFDNLDKGRITEHEFREKLNHELGTQFSDRQIDDAWNAMLGEIPVAKLKLLQEVHHSFQTFLLSNTNIIHIKQITKYLAVTYGRPNLDDLFDNVYYSFVVDARKPDPAIFLKVINDNDLKPAETLFIDDSPQHIEGAKLVGLNAALYSPKEDLRSFLENYLGTIGAQADS